MSIQSGYSNPIDLLRYILTCQNWGDNETGEPSVSALIRLGVGVSGSFDSVTLDPVRNISIRYMIDTEDKGATKDLINKICTQFDLIQYTDASGYECVKYLFAETSDTAIPLFIIDETVETGSYIAPDQAKLCVNPIIDYDYDYGLEKFKKTLEITNVHSTGTYSSSFTFGFENNDGETYWTACRNELWPQSRHVEDMDSELRENEFIYTYQGALFRLTNVIKTMKAATLDFTVPFTEGVLVSAGDIISLMFPHLQYSGEVVYDAVVTGVTKSFSGNYVTIECMFIGENIPFGLMDTTDGENWPLINSYDPQPLQLADGFNDNGNPSDLTYTDPSARWTHITQINDNLTTLISEMDNCQIGIDTDNDDFTYKNDAGVLYVGAKQKHWSGTDWIYDDIDARSLTFRNSLGAQSGRLWTDTGKIMITGAADNSGLYVMAPLNNDVTLRPLFSAYYNVDGYVTLGNPTYLDKSHIYIYGDINIPEMTASRALVLNSSNQLQTSPVTNTELGYLSGKNSVIDGAGSVNYIPIFTGINRLGNSIVTGNASGIEINTVDSNYNGGVRIVADETHIAGIFLGCTAGGYGTQNEQWSIYRDVASTGGSLIVRHGVQELFEMNTTGSVTIGQLPRETGGSAPRYLSLGSTYSVNPVSSYCKLFLYNDKVNFAGSSIGSSGDVQYHSSWSTGRHDFYIADTLRMRITNTVIEYNGNTVWHAGNDGSGSGLDADTLDTYHASNFLGKNGNTHYQSDGGWIQFPAAQGLYNPNSGSGIFFNPVNGVDLTYGSYMMEGTKNGYSGLVLYNSFVKATFMSSLTHPYTGIMQQSNNHWQWYHDGTDFLIGTPSDGNVYKAWHAGNDGDSSGLDADLLDGYHASNFIGKFGSNYYRANSWIEFTGEAPVGLYWSTGTRDYAGATPFPSELYTNEYFGSDGGYANLVIYGYKNGYSGFKFEHSLQLVTFMTNVTNCLTGVYQQTNSRWQWYHDNTDLLIGRPNVDGNMFKAWHAGNLTQNLSAKYLPFWNGTTFANSYIYQDNITNNIYTNNKTLCNHRCDGDYMYWDQLSLGFASVGINSNKIPYISKSSNSQLFFYDSRFVTDGTNTFLDTSIITTSSFNDGLRIGRSGAGYSLVALGATGFTGTQDGQWTWYTAPSSDNYKMYWRYINANMMSLTNAGDLWIKTSGGDGITFWGSQGNVNSISATANSNSQLQLQASGATIRLQDSVILFTTNCYMYDSLIVAGAEISFGLNESDFRIKKVGTQLVVQKLQSDTWTTVSVLAY